MNVTERYREIRRCYPDYPARNALSQARDEQALEIAEWQDRIRFTVEHDPEAPETPDWPEAETQRWLRDLREGHIAVYVVSAEVPATCPHCGQPTGEWAPAGSVHGVDVYLDDESYVRVIQADLAREAGVIP